MNILIRPERPGEYRKTEHVIREAFWNVYLPGCTEHYLAHLLRGHSAFVPALDLVAVHDGTIVGNSMCIRSVVQGDDGQSHEVLSLGPFSVLPGFQCRGIGGSLLEESKKRARAMKFRAILLFGDPAYYSRHGFAPAESLGIRTSGNQYTPAHQVCELSTGALHGVRGRALEDPVYAVDDTAVQDFDAQFPRKKKICGTESQKRFEMLLSLLRDAEV